MTDTPTPEAPVTRAGKRLLANFGNRATRPKWIGFITQIEAEAVARDREALAAKVRALLGQPWWKGGPDEDYMCPNCLTPWKCNGPHKETSKVPDGFDVDRAAVLTALAATPSPAPTAPLDRTLRDELGEALHEQGFRCDLRPNPHGVMVDWADHDGDAAHLIGSINAARLATPDQRHG